MRKGFTVPEVLAVVAIMTIILSILLPALNKMRVPAYQAMCATNNRQLVQAAYNYGVDNSQWLPFTNWGSQEGGWGKAGWLYHPSSRSQPDDHHEGQLWPYLKDEVYRCPQDKPPFIANSTHMITSYLYNGSFSGFGNASGGGQPYIYKSHRFSSDAIMFWEVDSLSHAGYYNDGSSFPNEAITQRHLTGLTVGCRDGHTEWLTYPQYWVEETKKPGRLWCKPGSATGQ
jgi:prepilin-type N-terminal cleavage/methylation domain-containing protein